jgi:hypothetical protein
VSKAGVWSIGDNGCLIQREPITSVAPSTKEEVRVRRQKLHAGRRPVHSGKPSMIAKEPSRGSNPQKGRASSPRAVIEQHPEGEKGQERCCRSSRVKLVVERSTLGWEQNSKVDRSPRWKPVAARRRGVGRSGSQPGKTGAVMPWERRVSSERKP